MADISRRQFIKGAGMAAGSVAYLSFFPVPASALENQSMILTAGRMGPIAARVEDGKLVETRGALEATVPNSLQLTGPDQVHTQARVRYPMVRKGFLDNPGVPDGKRGDDEFVRVSWDDAYALIHEQHRRIREEYGAESVFAGSYGWRSSGVLHKAQSLLQRYMSMAGGYSGHLGDYSTGAAQVIMPHVVGSMEVYEQQTTFPVVMEHSDVVVLWGLNPINTLKIAWTSSDGAGLEFFRQLRDSGKRIIAIDPMRSETIEFMGDSAEWIAPYPMTDVAMLMGVAHALVDSNQHDREFLDTYTEGYDRFEQYLLGASDGVAKTPEWAADISGVPAADIRRLAELFSNNRTMLMAGWGIQRQEYGEQPHWMLVTLASMLGQIGLPGGGFGFSYHYSNGGNPTRDAGILSSIPNVVDTGEGNVADGLPWESTGAVNSIPVARIVEALENPGVAYQHNGSELVFPDIRMIWWAGGSNFTHHQDTNRLIKAWQKPEMVVISEIYWTGAARHADIVLPITTSFERNDLTMTGDYSNQHLVPMKQVIAPQFEARNDLDVFADMAERLYKGGRDVYLDGKSEMQWLKGFYNSAKASGRALRVPMPNFGYFWERNALIEMVPNAENARFNRYADFREDPLLNPLGTPSGKIEIYSRRIASFNYDDCPPHPTWMTPSQWHGNAEPGELQLMSSHAAHRLHSQFNYASLRERYAIANREPISINTRDAEARGIEDGDLVRAYNDQGQVLVGALVTDAIRPGAVCIHEGAWVDLDKNTGICKNGEVNVLTRDIPTSRLANGCAGNSNLVRIEKYTGPELELTAFTPPRSAMVS